MTSLDQTTSTPFRKPIRAHRQVAAWQKAMVKFQKALNQTTAAFDAYAAAEEAELTARRALENLQPPASLVGRGSVEFHFDGASGKSVLRRSIDPLVLQDEQAIERHTEDDPCNRNFLLGELRSWRDHRSRLEIALKEATAVEEAVEKAWCAASEKSEAQQLRILQTPSPTLCELRWKLESLCHGDCATSTIEVGLNYVISESAAFAARKVGESDPPN